ncbi:IS630 family transposase [Desulfomarina sp.]
MIKIVLSEAHRTELINFRRQASSKDSEKALMVLMNADNGMSVPQIAKTLKRNPHTVRDWLKRYKTQGLAGLSRKFSPGRPADKRKRLKRFIEEILVDPPTEHGFQDNTWTVPLIVHYTKNQEKLPVSRDTVVRALKDLGYSYKRPAKTVPGHAPSAEEKRLAIDAILKDIQNILAEKETVIYALDEAHFSTEPYLVQGWFKKRWPPSNSNASQARKSYVLWMLESDNTKILLEKIQIFEQ